LTFLIGRLHKALSIVVLAAAVGVFASAGSVVASTQIISIGGFDAPPQQAAAEMTLFGTGLADDTEVVARHAEETCAVTTSTGGRWDMVIPSDAPCNLAAGFNGLVNASILTFTFNGEPARQIVYYIPGGSQAAPGNDYTGPDGIQLSSILPDDDSRFRSVEVDLQDVLVRLLDLERTATDDFDLTALTDRLDALESALAELESRIEALEQGGTTIDPMIESRITAVEVALAATAGALAPFGQ
jgi:hypothetical protein